MPANKYEKTIVVCLLIFQSLSAYFVDAVAKKGGRIYSS
jgi:hypothetical protein